MATPTKAKHTITPQTAPQLSKNELDRITEVFKIYETGLREATIYPKVNKNDPVSTFFDPLVFNFNRNFHNENVTHCIAFLLWFEEINFGLA